jgi:tetratricopeptide (TPR) repeat protein
VAVVLTDMMMFPDFPHKQTMVAKPPFTEAEFRDGVARVQNNAPFIRPLLWRGRVEDALQRTGDAASAIVGLQTAAEALLFDTYRMLLVDEGHSRQEIDAKLTSDPAVGMLVKTLLKDKLGGHWDPTVVSTPVGWYWEKLYQVRNDVVHRGFEPHFGHAEEARDAYTGLVEFIAGRLRRKTRTYPRTLLALLGEEGLRDRGGLSGWMKQFAAEVKVEPGSYSQPWDEAGRHAGRRGGPQLAEVRPDASRPALASALSNESIRLPALLQTESIRLAHLGRREAALAASAEAVNLRRQLADVRPEIFGPGLASALSNQSFMLAALGQYQYALAATEEALSLIRQLAAERPDRYLPELGQALTNHSINLGALDRPTDSSVHSPRLGRSLSASSDGCSKLRRHQVGKCPDARRQAAGRAQAHDQLGLAPSHAAPA